MPPISMLIKPASSACNMKCKYCFYNAIANNRTNAFTGMMSIEILEKLVKEALETAEGHCSFGFQGGEPTLRGLDFYKTFIELIRKYNKKNLSVHCAIQTNGVLIDDEWASFLAENKFLVGLSLDGPEEIHNLNRIKQNDHASFNDVMRAARIMTKHKVDFNILCVVTGRGARSIEKIYNFFKKQGFRYLQFIPCLEPIEQERGSTIYALSVKDFEEYLIRLFDLWYNDYIKANYISIRHIDNTIRMLRGEPPELCSMSGCCTIQYVVEGDGGVYPCDFYVFDEWRLGTIGVESIAEMRESEQARSFIEGSRVLPEKCRSCRFLGLCRNGCRRDRMDDTGLNYYCEAWKNYYDYILKKLRI
ncbi:MAG TPA: anaerobic sulfatase maturase [Clostridiaceae bacterium]|nr:anaerobic sulfatase maturase [Clostridiaceae bacterium]